MTRDIPNIITFARLNIIPSSITTPNDLIFALQEISQNLLKNNLPLPTKLPKIAQYLEIIGAPSLPARELYCLCVKITGCRTIFIYLISPILYPNIG